MRRLIILLTAVGALLVAPAAHAEKGVEPLKVSLTGTGNGKAYIDAALTAYRGDPEIDCKYTQVAGTQGTCETIMSNEGEGWEQVYVTALAKPGSEFVGWTVENSEFEGCGAIATCAPFVEPEGTGSGEAEIIATFKCKVAGTCNQTYVPLKVVKTGLGTVISSPAGIECVNGPHPVCEEDYALNETVTLTASPAVGYAFSGWSSCTEVSGLTCKVKMEKAKTVKATFIETPSLTIEKAGSGYGKVSATGISCDESCSKDTAAVKAGSSVTIKTAPAKGSEAAVIEGGTGSASACSGSTCTFTISEASSVKVKYNPIPTRTLTVKLIGPGAYKGKVTGKGTTVKGLVSTAISCGSGCTTETETFFATGTTELVAAAGTGYSFKGWKVEGGSAGGCTGTTSPCTLETSANKTVIAKFE